MMGLKIGSKVPDFSAMDQDGNNFDSAGVVGKKPVVLFFYPKDHTPGCTKEVCSFRDNYEIFREFGAEVIGISSDNIKTHKNFAKKYRLPFLLLADTDKKLRRLFKVENRFFNLLPGRETFLIDSKGKVVMAFNNVNPSKHIKMAISALKEECKR